jgi:hypothetical protein
MVAQWFETGTKMTKIVLIFLAFRNANDRRRLFGRPERHRRAGTGRAGQHAGHAAGQDDCDVASHLHFRHAAGYQ